MCVLLERLIAEILIYPFNSKILTLSDEQGVLWHPHVIVMV